MTSIMSVVNTFLKEGTQDEKQEENEEENEVETMLQQGKLQEFQTFFNSGNSEIQTYFNMYTDNNGVTLLMKACMLPSLSIIKWIVSVVDRDFIDKQDVYGYTALMYATKNRLFYVIISILYPSLGEENERSVNLVDYCGNTIVHLLCYKRQSLEAVARKLNSRYINWTLKNQRNKTPLMISCELNDEKNIKFLWSENNVKTSDVSFLLDCLIEFDKYDYIKTLDLHLIDLYPFVEKAISLNRYSITLFLLRFIDKKDWYMFESRNVVWLNDYITANVEPDY